MTDWGLTIIEGPYGAGKSYAATRHLVREVIATRRPCYTNLPIRRRVMKKYLELKIGGDPTGLIHEITEEQFERFINRVGEVKRLQERVRSEKTARGETYSRAEFAKVVEAELGRHVMSGEGLNWIPPGALIVLDEVHHWYPQTGTKESVALRNWLSMIRHYQQHCIVITQDVMQMTHTLRRPNLVREWVKVLRIGHIRPPVLPVQLKTFGLDGLFYTWWDPQDLAQAGRRAIKPTRRSIVFPNMGYYSWVFRLYDSQTQGASDREVAKITRQLREEAGLDADGENEAMKKRKRRPITMVHLIAASLAGGATVKVLSERNEVVRYEEQSEAGPPMVVGRLGEDVVIGDRIVGVGEWAQGFQLAGHFGSGAVWIDRDGVVWVSGVGVEGSRRIGEASRILETAVARLQARAEGRAGEQAARTP